MESGVVGVRFLLNSQSISSKYLLQQYSHFNSNNGNTQDYWVKDFMMEFLTEKSTKV